MNEILDLLAQDWLLGIIVGFILSETKTAVQSFRKRRRAKKALWDELRANRHQIFQKIDIIDQMIAALQAGRYLSGNSVPHYTTVFDSQYVDAIQKLRPVERDDVHWIYGSLQVHDEFLSSFERRYKEDLGNGILSNPSDAHVTQLSEVRNHYSIVADVIEKLLSGAPVDVLHRHQIIKPDPT